jgi:hypothetical protein
MRVAGHVFKVLSSLLCKIIFSQQKLTHLNH